MVVKVYVSGISGNKEVKKRQQRVLMILDSKNIKYDVIDITEPGREADKDFMQNNSKSNGGTVSDPNPRSPLPPQIFNDEEYCGDYDLFDLANEVDTLEQYLKLEVPPEESPQVNTEKEKPLNGDVDGVATSNEENSDIKEDAETPEKGEDTADDNEKSPVKEGSPAKEGTPLRETNTAPSEEGTPSQDENENAKGDAKEISTEKETEERQKSVEMEGTPEEENKQASKENSPDKEELVNENGTVSSRDSSKEKETENEQTDLVNKDNPSESLIQSEQAASAE